MDGSNVLRLVESNLMALTSISPIEVNDMCSRKPHDPVASKAQSTREVRTRNRHWNTHPACR
jgi:hypothetical protein